jgi:hypothetical protein
MCSFFESNVPPIPRKRRRWRRGWVIVDARRDRAYANAGNYYRASLPLRAADSAGAAAMETGRTSGGVAAAGPSSMDSAERPAIAMLDGRGESFGELESEATGDAVREALGEALGEALSDETGERPQYGTAFQSLAAGGTSRHHLPH